MFGATLGLLFVALAWGSVIPAINLLLPVWDPYFLAAGRYLVGAPIFILLLRVFEPGPLLRQRVEVACEKKIELPTTDFARGGDGSP